MIWQSLSLSTPFPGEHQEAGDGQGFGQDLEDAEDRARLGGPPSIALAPL
jgi:hypothetical protein